MRVAEERRSRQPGAPWALPSPAHTSRLAFPASWIGTVALVGLLATTIALLFSGRSALLTLVFPAMAVGASAILSVTDPARYLALVAWLWMVSPFVRRVVDAQNGWNPQNAILLAPLLASAIGAVAVVQHAGRLRRRVALPMVLALVALAGGIAVGLGTSAPSLVLYAGLSWAAPVLLGLYVAVQPEHHVRMHRALGAALLVGLMVIGAYGVAQFVSPPLWDRLWMLNSRMNSIGTPEPFLVRVFSTLNAPGPLAQFLSAAVLMVLAREGARKWPPVLLGIVGLLLALARSAWLGFAVGAIALFVMTHTRVRRGMMALGAVTAVAITLVGTAPLPASLDAMRQTVTSRITTMRELSMDDSFRARRYLIPAVMAQIGEQPLGSGLGATLVGGARGAATSRLADQGLYLDNGILEILLVLGWFGGLLFLGGAGLALLDAFRHARRLPEAAGYFAAALALLTQVIGGTVFAGVGGAMFWMAVAFASGAAGLQRTAGVEA